MTANTGIDARLDRIGTDGRYLVVPMDHGITMGAVTGLKDIESTIDGVTRGGADAVLTQKGIAPRVHPNKNGKGYIVHVNASTTIGPDGPRPSRNRPSQASCWVAASWPSSAGDRE